MRAMTVRMARIKRKRERGRERERERERVSFEKLESYPEEGEEGIDKIERN